ncbi:MAG: tyrosine-type recombinase/integrase [Actinomycetota bacterium]|nr:tyrosine-type recombinase/integrase [Actinomycetota bacterium]
MNAIAASPADPQRSQPEIEWSEIAAAAPQLAETMSRYLRQAATFLAPASVDSADGALRVFARWLLANTSVVAVAEVNRDAIEDFKVYLAGRPGMRGRSLSENTQRQRLRTLRVFFERIIEWDWADTPRRNPILNWDLPKRPEPLPKFLDDTQAAKLMAAARASRDPRDRLIVELLARTGMRSGELTALDADAMVRIGQGHWLRIPIGKLRNDRYVPLHPQLVDLLNAWTATNLEHIREHRRLVADHRGPLNRFIVERTVARVGRAAGVEDVHPHRLRHTLATQAINRGMRLEAIAALLGHRKMEMTLVYARIANRVVADEYEAVSAKIDALYGQQLDLPADYETTGMAKLRRESQARMLGNGLCTRPVELDCRMESACETCSYFRTGTEFLPILTRQRDHASEHGQVERAALFDGLIQRTEASPDPTDAG